MYWIRIRTQGTQKQRGPRSKTPRKRLQNKKYLYSSIRRPENVGILGNERLVDDAPLVFGFLEVRVREQEEHLGELAFPEEVGQILHGIAPGTSVAK
jgi:hypothetical protein